VKRYTVWRRERDAKVVAEMAELNAWLDARLAERAAEAAADRPTRQVGSLSVALSTVQVNSIRESLTSEARKLRMLKRLARRRLGWTE
jgi:DNA-binding response OmpR family regulator